MRWEPFRAELAVAESSNREYYHVLEVERDMTCPALMAQDAFCHRICEWMGVVHACIM